MKKSKAPARRARASARTAKTATTVDEYFATVPKPARAHLTQLRSAIRSVLPPDTTETISYGIPAFRRKRVLVWYAAFANHCSLFPTAVVIDAFKDELQNFTLSKGTIQFPLDKPLPVPLIKKIVKARLAAESKAWR